MSERVLVTGAGGFIGSHLVEALVRRGDRVRAMVRYNGRSDWGRLERLSAKTLKRVEVVAGDVTDPFFADEAVRGMDAVYHLAALIAIPYSYAAPQSYVSVNIQGTLNMLQACLRRKVRRMQAAKWSELSRPTRGELRRSMFRFRFDECLHDWYRFLADGQWSRRCSPCRWVRPSRRKRRKPLSL